MKTSKQDLHPGLAAGKAQEKMVPPFRTRTGNSLRNRIFECGASTNSAKGAYHLRSVQYYLPEQWSSCFDPIAAQWLHVAGLPMESSPAHLLKSPHRFGLRSTRTKSLNERNSQRRLWPGRVAKDRRPISSGRIWKAPCVGSAGRPCPITLGELSDLMERATLIGLLLLGARHLPLLPSLRLSCLPQDFVALPRSGVWRPEMASAARRHGWTRPSATRPTG